tara:strand:- start:594 stop:794 length:201 start_codon:yes stop_codon:yes gene_type:complete
MEKYWKIYDKLASNKQIPKALKKSIYSIVQRGQKGKLSEEEVRSEILDLTNKMKASCNFVEMLMKE